MLSIAGRPAIFWTTLAGAALMVVGGFGPWASVLGLAKVSGTDGDGWLLILGGAMAAGLLYGDLTSRSATPWPSIFMGLVGIAGCAVTIIDLTDISSTASGTILEGAVDPAGGIYAALLGSLVVGASGAIGLRLRPYAVAQEANPVASTT
jgi:hypothetical protein